MMPRTEAFVCGVLDVCPIPKRRGRHRLGCGASPASHLLGWTLLDSSTEGTKTIHTAWLPCDDVCGRIPISRGERRRATYTNPRTTRPRSRRRRARRLMLYLLCPSDSPPRSVAVSRSDDFLDTPVVPGLPGAYTILRGRFCALRERSKSTRERLRVGSVGDVFVLHHFGMVQNEHVPN